MRDGQNILGMTDFINLPNPISSPSFGRALLNGHVFSKRFNQGMFKRTASIGKNPSLISTYLYMSLSFARNPIASPYPSSLMTSRAKNCALCENSIGRYSPAVEIYFRWIRLTNSATYLSTPTSNPAPSLPEYFYESRKLTPMTYLDTRKGRDVWQNAPRGPVWPSIPYAVHRPAWKRDYLGRAGSGMVRTKGLW